MQISDFKSTVSTFADPGSEILFEKNRVLISVNDELIELSISTRNGDVFVDDGTGEVSGSSWILRRLARLPLLASRLKESVGNTKMFVSPSASLLPSLQVQPDETLKTTEDALNTTLQFLGEQSPLETSVMYITSDAGEGKTFLINQMAREQAQRFIDGKTDWLIVPIPLGGKHFLRFDDITVGALQNRYRFPFLYYESFLSLVRMGVIVPAFDGFEEMFVENSSGEALSAMGILVTALDSRGSLVIATRKAYFEFESLKTQEKLFDAIRSYAVGFGKLELHRWGRKQFLAYCVKRDVPQAEEIFDRVSERIGAEHSLLTRPVLIRRLVDIATESSSLDVFLEKIHASGPDFFAVFVRGIVEREAIEKWIDRSGKADVGGPLLSTDEHCELLSDIAIATWEAKVDFLKRDHLEVLADLFSESKGKSSTQRQQIRERIRGHALLIASPNATQAVEFDHEEFRLFFLGEGIAKLVLPLSDRARGELLTLLRKGILPEPAQHAFVQAILRHPTLERLQVAKFLLDVSSLDGQASYTQENCSSLMIRFLNNVNAKNLEIRGISFSSDALRDGKLTGVSFKQCHFQPTSLDLSVLADCTFTDCNFAQLRIYDSTHFENVVFAASTVDSVRIIDKEENLWEPNAIREKLSHLGILFPGEEVKVSQGHTNENKTDQELADVEKLIRYFMRSTQISEKVVLIKLGNRAQSFIDSQLPTLLNRQIMIEVENRGGGSGQRFFRLGVPLELLNRGINAAHGSYLKFLDECSPNS
jgi:hypothetical protein